jgi:hypothetical protein
MTPCSGCGRPIPDTLTLVAVLGASPLLGYMVWPHALEAARTMRQRGRRTVTFAGELRQWWRERHPRPVAAFGHPSEDEPLWLTTVPMEHLRRQTLRLRRMWRKGRLRGGHITSLRHTWSELKRRRENADKPNRSVMDVLSEPEREAIDQLLQTKESGQ